jgi:hypothetical protein
MSRRRRWPWVLAATAVVVVVACCGLGIAFRNEIGCRLPLVECLDAGGQVYARNDRSDDLTLRVNSSSIDLDAGQFRALGDMACRESAVVAIDAQGQEVARLEPDPRCDTRTWIFAADATTSVVAGRAP